MFVWKEKYVDKDEYGAINGAMNGAINEKISNAEKKVFGQNIAL